MTNPYEPTHHEPGTWPAQAQQPGCPPPLPEQPPSPHQPPLPPPVEPAGPRTRPVLRRVVLGVVIAVIAAAAVYIGSTMLMPRPLADAVDTCDGTRAFDVVLADSREGDPETDSGTGSIGDGESETWKAYFTDRLALRDDGSTLVLDTLPEEDDPLGVSTFVLECVHISLDTPEWVRTNIGATRALDGRQQAEWDHYRAEWSYHPNSGLNLVIRMA